MSRSFAWVGAGLALFVVAFVAGRLSANGEPKDEKLFELRVYTAQAGKIDDLQRHFQEEAVPLFAQHKMKALGYWVSRRAAGSAPADPPQEDRFIYILEHPSLQGANEKWTAFRNDPAWKAAVDRSRAGGELIKKVESIFMTATSYSAIR